VSLNRLNGCEEGLYSLKSHLESMNIESLALITSYLDVEETFTLLDASNKLLRSKLLYGGIQYLILGYYFRIELAEREEADEDDEDDEYDEEFEDARFQPSYERIFDREHELQDHDWDDDESEDQSEKKVLESWYRPFQLRSSQLRLLSFRSRCLSVPLSIIPSTLTELCVGSDDLVFGSGEQPVFKDLFPSLRRLELGLFASSVELRAPFSNQFTDAETEAFLKVLPPGLEHLATSFIAIITEIHLPWVPPSLTSWQFMSSSPFTLGALNALGANIRSLACHEIEESLVLQMPNCASCLAGIWRPSLGWCLPR
jgi:hypothetical protein